MSVHVCMCAHVCAPRSWERGKRFFDRNGQLYSHTPPLKYWLCYPASRQFIVVWKRVQLLGNVCVSICVCLYIQRHCQSDSITFLLKYIAVNVNYRTVAKEPSIPKVIFHEQNSTHTRCRIFYSSALYEWRNEVKHYPICSQVQNAWNDLKICPLFTEENGLGLEMCKGSKHCPVSSNSPNTWSCP